MSDVDLPVPDEEREVPLDDETELELPPPTLDDRESIEEEPADEVREAAIEAGDIEPGD